MKRKRSFSRKFNPKRIKIGYSYGVKDLTEVFNISESTVFNWMRNGLKKIPLDSNKLLFHRKDLIDFLNKKRNKNKAQCKNDEFYCFRCQNPRKSIGNLVDIIRINDKIFQLKGLCSVCDGLIFRNGAIKKIEEILKFFDYDKKQLMNLI